MINMELDPIFDVIHLTQASLAKLEQSVSVNSDSDSTTIASTSVNHDAYIADLSDLETGMSLIYRPSKSAYDLFLAVPGDFMTEVEFDVIQHVRDMLDNFSATGFTSDVSGPQGPSSFRKAVCHQIAALANHLQVAIIMIETLADLAQGLTSGDQLW